MSTVHEQTAMSLEDILKEGWQGRRFFKIAQESCKSNEEKPENEAKSSENGENVLLEICIKPREFCDMNCKLLIIRNISHVARQEKL